MKKLSTIIALTLAASMSFAGGNGSDRCDGTGFYNSQFCHQEIENRVSDLETQISSGALNGADGQDGLDGTNGTNGIDGQDGIDGIDGQDGLNGIDGTNGQAGAKGDQGETGATGKQGDQGLQGEAGTDGLNGQDGKDGLKGADGKDGAIVDVSGILSGYRSGIAQSSAIASLPQAPHDRSGLALACAGYEGATECAIGASWSPENSNHLIKFSFTKDIQSVGWAYHFGK